MHVGGIAQAIVAMATTADRLENTEYDLIVIGTGFVESLVARCGGFRPQTLLIPADERSVQPHPPPSPMANLPSYIGLRSAAARAGKRVLHLDAASSYGTHWAALHLDDFVAWATNLQARGRDVAANGHIPDGEQQSDAAARYMSSISCS